MRVGFFGPSGSGKTMSALRFAKGLVGSWDKIAVIDTEQGSADLYSHLGEYNTLQLSEFGPDNYVAAIEYVESIPSIECLVIDSISHEWEGVGGCLDIHAKMGGRFETWAKVTPMHNKFIQAILQSRLHVLVTGRSKIDYDMSKDEKGKAKIEKVGLKTITREGLDYEMTVAFRIGHDHLVTIDKDRTDIFKSPIPFMITEETGKKVRDWNDNGKPDFSPTMVEILKIIKEVTNNFQDKDALDGIVQKYGKSSDMALLPIEKQTEILTELKLLQEENQSAAVEEELLKAEAEAVAQ